MRTLYDTTALEKALKQILRNGEVSTNVYDDRPKADNSIVNDFTVVKVTGTVQDTQAYGRCMVAISLFARDVAGRKNTDKLSYMYGKLMEAMPYETEKYLFDSTPQLIGDTGDSYGFHARVIKFNTIIKAV